MEMATFTVLGAGQAANAGVLHGLQHVDLAREFEHARLFDFAADEHFLRAEFGGGDHQGRIAQLVAVDVLQRGLQLAHCLAARHDRADGRKGDAAVRSDGQFGGQFRRRADIHAEFVARIEAVGLVFLAPGRVGRD